MGGNRYANHVTAGKESSMTRKYGIKLHSVLLALVTTLAGGVSHLAAQQGPPCASTLQCAQIAAQTATEAAAAVQALQSRIEALEKALNTFDRFVTVQSALIPQHAEAQCPANTRIISAACVGNNGTPQAAVGPQFDFNGSGKALCDRYGNVVMPVQATAVCLKIN
jgi:hypothetical protein